MSHEIDDIIDNTPKWLLRSGISIVGIITIVIISLSTLIKYPDKIICLGVMTSSAPPIEHRSKIGGVIDTIYVRDHQFVPAEKRLLLIQNPCKVEHLDSLIHFINRLEKLSNFSEYLKLDFPVSLQLGELQREYAELENIFFEFVINLKESSLKKQLEITKLEILQIDHLNDVLIKQKQYSDKEMSLILKDNSRNALLKEQGVISDLDMEKSERGLLTFQNQSMNLESSIIGNQIRKQQLLLEEKKTNKEIIEFETRSVLRIKEIISGLKQSFKVWEDKYLITAKISGLISFDSKVTSKLMLSPDDAVVNIVPSMNFSEKYVRATSLQSFGIGKIKDNDKAILKMQDYPYKEYGIIVEQVSSVSLLPKLDKNGQSNYEFIIPLPDTIRTSYGIEIPYKPNASVNVEIITEDKSILQRIFKEFLNLIDNF